MGRISKILVVNQDPTVTRALEGVFPEFEFCAIPAKNIDASQLGTVDADLALIDEELPQHSGTELMAELRSKKPELPVILFTDCRIKTKQAMANGAFGVIESPKDFDELQEMIWLLLDEQRILRK